ncbi:IclR family transcriptional regulator [Agromyces bracchium]|uniref:Helix-turn-helix domain-containing protein n=1 Tax=Agromyces bracchium TaxID=88376 RepID=A0A6I3MGA9_9MICO|nr:IclR family transcriptional regulator [Agromyces bracchium]MTH70406.1 helix-turn-helix domain-containing protein [Agromyces bracchium]
MTSTKHVASSDKSPAPAVSRAIKLLDLLGRHGGTPLTLGEIAASIDAAKSSTLNILQVLEDGGMVARVQGGYKLGRRNLELGGAYLSGFSQMREFYNFCSVASLLSHEVVQVAMLVDTDVVYLARHEGRAPMRFIATIGSRFPAAPTAVGNALLTTLSDDEVARRFSGPQHFPLMTENSVRNLPDLLRKISSARERGYAIDDNEVHPGIYGVARVLPPWSSGDQPLAIGTSLAAASATPAYVSQIVDELGAAVSHLSNPLFHSVASPPTDFKHPEVPPHVGI